MKTNLAVLIQAAEYLERKDREMEHGYATVLPMPENYDRHTSSKYNNLHNNNNIYRRSKSKSKHVTSRSTHNELEKNRRAHLKFCLDKLKELVPLAPDGSRHTTLGLLTRAKSFIKNLEDVDRKQNSQKEILKRDQRYLRRRLESLESQVDFISKRRSLSESSGISVESSTSSSPPTSSSPGFSNSETEEVDILGYGSNQSDTDDHSSVQSLGSDSRGVILSTRRLTIAENQLTVSH